MLIRFAKQEAGIVRESNECGSMLGDRWDRSRALERSVWADRGRTTEITMSTLGSESAILPKGHLCHAKVMFGFELR